MGRRALRQLKPLPGHRRDFPRDPDDRETVRAVRGHFDIQDRLAVITKAVAKIEQDAANTSGRIFKKLRGRIADLLNESTIDPERVHREAAFLAERGDITEELVRMRSHLELFSRRLKIDGEVGRELDFLCQEMNREVNTMGSKSQFFEISTEVVLIKGELEKIREQVQNIE